MIAKPLIRFRISRFIKKSARLRHSTPYARAKNVGILYSSNDMEKHQAIKRFVNEIENSGKKVEVITFLDKGKDNHEFMFKYYTKNVINFWGNFTNDDVEAFVKKEFDFIYFLDFKTDLYSKYILSMSKARCRVGPVEENGDQFFELMVKPKTKTITSLLDTMKQYSQSIL